MKDSSALITVAMLSAMLRERYADYVDIISPFVLTLLPLNIGVRIDPVRITEELSTQYGFDQFPIYVLQKILTRYSKSKHGYLEKRNGDFYVKKPYESIRFSDNQRKIRESQNAVMQELQIYLKSNSRYSEISVDKSREMFLLFLEQKGLAFIDGIDELKTVTSKDYDIYQVARFVLSEHEKKSIVFTHIEEVVRGFFVYKSIYFFGRDCVSPTSTKMKGTTVYLDTSLLIEALGYDTKESSIAAKELISLIKASGGYTKTFSHLVDEVAGILTAFAKDKANRVTFRLSYLLENNYDEIDVLRLRTNLESNLLKLGISIDDPITYKDLYTDEYDPLQINDLSLEIQTSYKQEFPTSRSDNDVLSVATIYHIRGGARASSLNNCKSVMATTNLGFAYTVNSFYKGITSHDVDYVVSNIDMTAVLWLRSWDKKSDLPSIVLLENAYAACQPTPELLAAFVNTVEKLRGEGLLSDEEALLLRTQPAPRNDLITSSQNDSDYINDKTVLEIQKRYKDSLIMGKNSTIARLQSELDSNRQQFKGKEFAAISRAEAKARKAADAYARNLKVLVKSISILLILAGFVALFYSEIQADIALVWKIPLIIIGILGLIDVVKSREGYITRLIQIAKNKRFDKIYSEEIERVRVDFC